MDCDVADCFPFPSAGFNLGVGIMYLGFGGTSAWWCFYSRRERVDTYAEGSGPQAKRSPPGLALGPGWVSGTF